jgi:hypothetical protein
VRTLDVSRNSLEERELAIDFGDRLGQHLAVARGGCSLELLRQPLAGKNQPLAFPVALLLVGREGRPGRFARVGHLGLLLFDRLALPSSGHFEILVYFL